MTGQNSEYKKGIALIYPWFICLLAAFFYSYDFLLRVTPSIMIHPLMAEFNVQATEIGLISAFYYYAYTPLQLPSGMVSDKFNPRWVLGLSALCCTLGAFLFATAENLMLAYVSRLMMGIGSAFAFVGALKLGSLWLPKKHFALFSGVTTAMGTLGAMTADTFLSNLLVDIGWRKTLYVSALVGLVITVLIILLIRENPQKPKQNAEYYEWGTILKRMLLLFLDFRFLINGLVAACLFLPVSVFASLWGVDFIAERFQIKASDAASMTSLIFLGMAFSGPFTGWLSEKIKSQKRLLLLGGFLVFIFSATLIYASDIPLFLVYPLLFAIGLSVGPQVLSFVVAKEISPKGSTGLSTAATNFIVTLGAAVLQPLIGYFLELSWSGEKTAMGTPHYAVADYRHAFYVLLTLLAFSFLLTFFIPSKKKDAPI
jgi:MFS family permease